MICLRDPLELASEPILVPLHAFFLLAHMDGKTTLADMQVAFRIRFGQTILSDQIEELIALLDKIGFMEGEAFQRRLHDAIVDYRNCPVRPSALAGQAYPEDPKEIRAMINGFFDGLPSSSSPKKGGRLAGIVAPHIDLHRGGALFARAYDALRTESPPHTVLILGTAHYGDGGIYILSAKDFETPLGVSRVD
ncbi:MAG: AmmeMemoRadiSam system protein B, partial [Planctomycetes bacterium]|nr:AmmeMemoRadiSam system protein B [Planctomycetota bacterium]